jgi:hypothetical protein
MNTSADFESDDKIRRLDEPVRELIEEGFTFVDHQAWLEAAAARASVNLQEALPTAIEPEFSPFVLGSEKMEI